MVSLSLMSKQTFQEEVTADSDGEDSELQIVFTVPNLQEIVDQSNNADMPIFVTTAKLARSRWGSTACHQELLRAKLHKKTRQIQEKNNVTAVTTDKPQPGCPGHLVEEAEVANKLVN